MSGQNMNNATFGIASTDSTPANVSVPIGGSHSTNNSSSTRVASAHSLDDVNMDSFVPSNPRKRTRSRANSAPPKPVDIFDIPESAESPVPVYDFSTFFDAHLAQQSALSPDKSPNPYEGLSLEANHDPNYVGGDKPVLKPNGQDIQTLQVNVERPEANKPLWKNGPTAKGLTDETKRIVRAYAAHHAMEARNFKAKAKWYFEKMEKARVDLDLEWKEKLAKERQSATQGAAAQAAQNISIRHDAIANAKMTEAQINHLDDEVEALEEKLARSDEKCKRLQEANEILEKKPGLELEVEKRQGQISKLQREIKSLKLHLDTVTSGKEAEAAKAEIKMLGELKNADEKTTQLHKYMMNEQTHKKQLKYLGIDLEKTLTMISDLELKLDTKSDRIHRLEAEKQGNVKLQESNLEASRFLEAELEQTKKDYSSLEKRFKSLREDLRVYQKEKEELDVLLQRSRKDYSNLKFQYDLHKRTHDASINSNQAEYLECQQENEKLKKMLSDLQMEVPVANQLVSAAHENIASLKMGKEELEHLLEQASTEYQSLALQLQKTLELHGPAEQLFDATKQELDATGQALTDVKLAYDQLTSAHAQVKSQLSEVKSQLSEETAKCNAVSKALSEVKKQHAEVESALYAAKNANDGADDRLAESQGTVRTLQNSLRTTQQELDSAKLSIDDANDKVYHLDKAHEADQRELQAAREVIQRRDQELNSMAATSRDFKKLQHELDTIKFQRDAIKAEKGKLIREVEGLQNRLEETLNERDTLAGLEKAAATENDLNDGRKSQEPHLAESTAELAQKDQDIETLTKKLSAASDKIYAERMRRQHVQGMLTKANEQLQTIEDIHGITIESESEPSEGEHKPRLKDLFFSKRRGQKTLAQKDSAQFPPALEPAAKKQSDHVTEAMHARRKDQGLAPQPSKFPIFTGKGVSTEPAATLKPIALTSQAKATQTETLMPIASALQAKATQTETVVVPYRRDPNHLQGNLLLLVMFLLSVATVFMLSFGLTARFERQTWLQANEYSARLYWQHQEGVTTLGRIWQHFIGDVYDSHVGLHG